MEQRQATREINNRFIEVDSKERLTAEMELKDPSSAVIKVRHSLPDFLRSVKLKYVKLGYGYFLHSWTTVMFLTSLLAIPLYVASLGPMVIIMDATLLYPCILLIVFLHWTNRSRSPVYLVDFACHLPGENRKMSVKSFLKMSEETGFFEEETMRFQTRISERSGLGDETYLSKGITSRPPNLCMEAARTEAETVIFGALDALFSSTGIEPSDVGILIVNCSLFNPTPSLTSMIVNRYKMSPEIKSYNLGGMGCSAGLVSIQLAKNMLQANPSTYAVVVSTENITLNWYFGNDRSMLLCNCIFRMGGAAVLLSNKASDRGRSKYELVHTVLTHMGADNRNYNCVFQKEDERGMVGVSLAKELMAVAGQALKTNITTLGPMVLPWSEQLKFLWTLVLRKIRKSLAVKPYIPNFKLAFEHFCIHAGGRAVLDELQHNLELSDWHMEPSRMTLHRFGNTSSSSLWYELAYTEAKGRVSQGDRVWQIAFGSGFKCNSAVWRAIRTVHPEEAGGSGCNPWLQSIHNHPIKAIT